MVMEYRDWIGFMLRDAKTKGDSSRISFFRELQSIVLKDKEDMEREWKKHEEEQNGRERLRVAKLLEIPPDQPH